MFKSRGNRLLFVIVGAMKGKMTLQRNELKKEGDGELGPLFFNQ